MYHFWQLLFDNNIDMIYIYLLLLRSMKGFGESFEKNLCKSRLLYGLRSL